MLSGNKFCVLVAIGIGVAFAAETPLSVTPAQTFGEEAVALSPEMLTNEGIVALADAGYSEPFLVGKILISNWTHFDTSAAGLAYLRRNAVSRDLVRFILERSAQPVYRPAPTLQPTAATAVLMKVHGKKNLYVLVMPPPAAAAPTPPVAPAIHPDAMPAAVPPVPVVSIPTAGAADGTRQGRPNAAPPNAPSDGWYNYAPLSNSPHAYPGYNTYPGYAVYSGPR